MTAITFNTAPFVTKSATKLRSVLAALRDALDAFAAYKMERAVSESELRRAAREIKRYRRLMQRSPARQTAADATTALADCTVPATQAR